MKQTVFLHSLFRAGSTYFFNKFRTANEYCCYYEPLHQDLVKLRKENIDTFWGFSPTSAVTLEQNHPELRKPHFYEYRNLFPKNDSPLPHFTKSFSFDEYQRPKSKGLKQYINMLINSAHSKGNTPLLQLNRSSMRIDWFKKSYPKSINIYLLRDPRDQFESYLNRSAKVFEIMNLLIIKSSPIFSQLLDKYNIPIYTENNFDTEYQQYMKVNNLLSIEAKYDIFFHIWMESLLQAIQYCDEVIIMDKLNRDNIYLKKIEAFLHTNCSNSINLSDFKLKKYSKQVMDIKTYSKLEYDTATQQRYSRSELQAYMLEMKTLKDEENLMQTTMISVITPSYNQGEFIEQTIRSVLSQKGNFYLDYIVVDGNSKDNSLSILEKYNSLLLNSRNIIEYKGLKFILPNEDDDLIKCRGISYRYVSETDRGQADAINKGFHQSVGDIICWINSDDYYYSEQTLSKVVDYFSNNTEIDFLYSRGGRANRNGVWLEEEKYVTNYELNDLKEVDFILQPASFWKRDIYEAIGDLDVNMHYAFDWEYWLRVADNFKIGFLNEITAMNRAYGETKTAIGGDNRAEEIYRLLKRYDSATERALRVYAIPRNIINKVDNITNQNITPILELANALENLCNISIRHPYKKYKAYKELLSIWHRNKFSIRSSKKL